jgi:hypothetical protein
MISAKVAPFGAFQQSDDFGLIGRLLRGLGLLGAFPRALWRGLWRFAVGPGIDGIFAHLLLLAARCGRHIHHSGSEKQQVESATNIRRGEVLAAGWQSAGLILFL